MQPRRHSFFLALRKEPTSASPSRSSAPAAGAAAWPGHSSNSAARKCCRRATSTKPNLEKGLEVGGADTKGYLDYKEVLARDDIDAVLIATPDHHHAPMLIDAVKAGKDVYCEKPMTHSISEGVRVIREVRATDRIVQIGMQRRSTPWIIETKKMVDDGLIGDIYAAKAQWNWIRSRPLNNSTLEGELDWKRFLGRAAYRPLEPMRFRSWRNFWDYSGGNLTDQGTHLMDVIQWLSNSGTPKSATCLGKVFEMSGAETPDIFSAAYEYRNMIATWTLNYNNDLPKRLDDPARRNQGNASPRRQRLSRLPSALERQPRADHDT